MRESDFPKTMTRGRVKGWTFQTLRAYDDADRAYRAKHGPTYRKGKFRRVTSSDEFTLNATVNGTTVSIRGAHPDRSLVDSIMATLEQAR